MFAKLMPTPRHDVIGQSDRTTPQILHAPLKHEHKPIQEYTSKIISKNDAKTVP